MQVLHAEAFPEGFAAFDNKNIVGGAYLSDTVVMTEGELDLAYEKIRANYDHQVADALVGRKNEGNYPGIIFASAEIGTSKERKHLIYGVAAPYLCEAAVAAGVMAEPVTNVAEVILAQANDVAPGDQQRTGLKLVAAYYKEEAEEKAMLTEQATAQSFSDLAELPQHELKVHHSAVNRHRAERLSPRRPLRVARAILRHALPV